MVLVGKDPDRLDKLQAIKAIYLYESVFGHNRGNLQWTIALEVFQLEF